jgi:hypothetical protein
MKHIRMRLDHILCASLGYFRVTKTSAPNATYYFGFARPLDINRQMKDVIDRTDPTPIQLSPRDSVFFRNVDRLRSVHVGPAEVADADYDARPRVGKIIVGHVVRTNDDRFRLTYWFADGRPIRALRDMFMRKTRVPKPIKIFDALGGHEALYVLARLVLSRDVEVFEEKHVGRIKDNHVVRTGYDLRGVSPNHFVADAAAFANDTDLYDVFKKKSDVAEDMMPYVRYLHDKVF